ncbi:MAG: glycosyltransferase family 8 protein [Akkermansia sp.]|nr:glycosyltransferase family 8 protein [Akkermansia sp.]
MTKPENTPPSERKHARPEDTGAGMTVPAECAHPIVVVYAADDAYLPYLLVSVSSLLTHVTPGTPCHIAVMEQHVSSFRKERLAEVVAAHPGASLQWLPVAPLDEKLDRLFEQRGRQGKVTAWSRTTYYRLFLASLLPECSRALYLDVDTLVCNDPSSLFQLDLRGNSVAAVTDVCLCFQKSCSEVRHTLADCGHLMDRYFNAGAMLFDLDRMRPAEDFEARLSSAFCSLEHLVYPDQDILNFLFARDHLELPPRWNFITPQMIGDDFPENILAARDELLRSGSLGIVHYAGAKPWRDPVRVPLAHMWWTAAREGELDADIAFHESFLIRKALEEKKEAGRANSLRIQRILLAARCAFASSSKREHLLGKLARVEAKLRRARSCRKNRL